MVSFPTPPGPEMTMIRLMTCGSACGEVLEQPLALLAPEALEATGLADVALLHEPAGLDLPQTGEGFEHRQHLILPTMSSALA